MIKMIQLVMLDVVKNRTVLAYLLLLSTLSWSVFFLEDSSTKGTLTLLNLMLLMIPLVSIIFSSIYIYNSSEFIYLLVSQPVSRKTIWISLYLGSVSALIVALFIGLGIPALLYLPLSIALYLISVGIAITATFSSFGFLVASAFRDKAKGIGVSILLWLFFAILFDGIILLLIFQFSAYPIEKAMIVVSMFSPLDLARILVLIQLDVASLLGYTGAIFQLFFGTKLGTIISAIVLLLWAVIPFLLSLKIFTKRDL
ncbi:MAG: ABC transporter permease subunit [Bacteroidia bacterium]|jgi:Cu-processing system permease protein|nr:ABC transporter permease subunit [Bacteroidia bacterium]